MAQSELLTTEDIDDISTVIQLKPHQKDIQFTTVTKSEEGDLVSLDELYEKSGQESISKVIAGFKHLIEKQRLSKEQGILLNIKGAEDWMELPDRMNAVKGGEGFINKMAQGFVKIVRAIINFIKGVCNWIYTRVKSLLGFSQTQEEINFLHQNTEKLKEYTVKLFEILGIYGYDPVELAKELPSNTTTWEMFTVLHNKRVDASSAVGTTAKLLPVIDNFYGIAKRAESSISKAKIKYDQIITALKKAVNAGHVDVALLGGIKFDIANIALESLPADEFVNAYSEIVGIAYQIDIPGIGQKKTIQSLKEKVAASTEKVKIYFDADVYETVAGNIHAFSEHMQDKANNIVLGEKAVGYLKKFIDGEDAEVIDSIVALTKDQDLLNVYLNFCETVKTYTAAIEAGLAAVQEIEYRIANLVNNYDKLTALIIGYSTENIKLIKALHKNLTPEEKAKLEDENGNLLYFKSLNDQFYKLHPKGHVSKKVSDAMATFFNTSHGKKILKVAANYSSRFKK